MCSAGHVTPVVYQLSAAVHSEGKLWLVGMRLEGQSRRHRGLTEKSRGTSTGLIHLYDSVSLRTIQADLKFSDKEEVVSGMRVRLLCRPVMRFFWQDP